MFDVIVVLKKEKWKIKQENTRDGVLFFVKTSRPAALIKKDELFSREFDGFFQITFLKEHFPDWKLKC